MSRSDWLFFTFSALGCLASALWILPILVVFSPVQRFMDVDECSLHGMLLCPNPNISTPMSLYMKAYKKTHNFWAYYRRQAGMLLIREYAILFEKPTRDHSLGTIQSVIIHLQAKTDKCDVILSCGDHVVYREDVDLAPSDFIITTCEMRKSDAIRRTIGVSVNCSDVTDAFFWVEHGSTSREMANGSVTPMLRIYHQHYVCSDSTPCTYDRDRYVRKMMQTAIPDNKECGLRYFQLDADEAHQWMENLRYW